MPRVIIELLTMLKPSTQFFSCDLVQPNGNEKVRASSCWKVLAFVFSQRSYILNSCIFDTAWPRGSQISLACWAEGNVSQNSLGSDNRFWPVRHRLFFRWHPLNTISDSLSWLLPSEADLYQLMLLLIFWRWVIMLAKRGKKWLELRGGGSSLPSCWCW